MLSRWSMIALGLLAVAGTAAACEGLSPGDQIQVGSSLCTLGFLVADPNGLYFTTAGHCVDVDDSVSSPGFESWGVGVFHFLEPENGEITDGAPGMDFGLIRVKPEFHDQLNPKMCGWDGPVGLYEGSAEGDVVRHYGHGLVFGELEQTRPREGYFLRTTEDAFYYTGLGVSGDSGSAVLSADNKAVGVFTHGQYGVTTEDNGGTRLQRGFRLAAEAGFPDLRLVLLGEDPVEVLASLQPPPAAPTAPTPSTPPAGAPPTAGSPASPSNSTAPGAPGTAPTTSTPAPGDSTLDPAEDDGGPAEPARRTPFLPTPLLLAAVAVALGVALRKRNL